MLLQAVLTLRASRAGGSGLPVGPPPRPAEPPRSPRRPAPLLAQAWRGGNRQALLSRLLTGCDTGTLDDTRARATGALAARSATSDIIDACVVEADLRRHDLIISSDPGDLQATAAAISQRLEIDQP